MNLGSEGAVVGGDPFTFALSLARSIVRGRDQPRREACIPAERALRFAAASRMTPAVSLVKFGVEIGPRSE